MPKRVKHSDPPAPPAGFSDYMKALGRKGGQVSGARRMENMTPAKRKAIAKKAARARWAKAKEAAE
jgi:hypothetical protein